MKHKVKRHCSYVLLSACLSMVSSLPIPDAIAESATDHQPTAEQARFFRTEVLPILKSNCFQCHAGEKVKGGLHLDSRAGLLKGGRSGAVVDHESPAASLLVEAINYESLEMPPKRKLGKSQIDTLTRWVKIGAPYSGDMPESGVPGHTGPPRVNAETMSWWSFQKVVRPDVPDVRNPGWVRTPVDAFVLSRLEKNGVTPARAADKARLVRRAFYDLIGLPPSPAQVRAFQADNSEGAYEALIDELLDSPHYGEKWGRHWLDVVRYAESNSYERDGTKPFVWRYRDYVIRSFNSDKPYNRFIIEQLAGDELIRATPESIIATAFHRLGIWQDEPVDPVESLYNDLDDILVTTSEAFLGLTIGCARCHDHKIDPIPQRDYYRMLAFFRNVRRYGVRKLPSVLDASVREIATPAEKARHKQIVDKHEQRLATTERELKRIEDLVRGEFSDVEREDFQDEMNRVAILKRHIGDRLNQRQFRNYEDFTRQREQLRRNQAAGLPQALCIKEHGRDAPPTFVLTRGNAHAHGEQVEPGFPSVLDPPEPVIDPPPDGVQSSGRRLALAEWIASRDNPLTARVIVNRLWQYHFGRGIVRSSGDFGFQGSPPTHPELLDWLAAEFMDGGWTLKRLHKLIMQSNTYRMSSQTDSETLASDEANDLFSRFDMRRLVAEEIRDSLLAVNGSLNLQDMFGPSMYPTLPQEVLQGQSRPGTDWHTSSPSEQARRSIYIHVKRSLAVPIMSSFDMADPDKTCAVRFVTTQPTQALGMLNSDFVNRQARTFAEYVKNSAGPEPARQVELALWRTTQRNPSPVEIQQGVDLIESLQRDEGASSDDALHSFCLVTLNLNEFMYLD